VQLKRPFGVSTHLYHSQRLGREHLIEIGAHGFDRIELFATRTHFDYHNPAAVADLQQWLADARLELHSVHAPIGESFSAGRWGPPLTLASAEPETRLRGLAEAERWCDVLVFQGWLVHKRSFLLDSDKVLVADVYEAVPELMAKLKP